MADTKISAMSSGSPAATGDELVIARSGANYKLTVAQLQAKLFAAMDVNGNSIVSASNGDITLAPNGTGNVVLGTLTLDGDQTVGAGQDNYVLTYDNGTGLISLEAAAGGDGTLTVEDNTAGVGSPNILTSGESGSVMTNAGSTATNYHTLPTAAAGLTFTFIDNDASDLLRIVANTSDAIRVGSSVSVSAGYLESTARGDAVVLVCVDGTDWVATSIVGTWNLETS